MGRYLRHLNNGAIKIDQTRVKVKAHLDGKSLLSTSDESLKPEDVALGYRSFSR